MADVVKQPRDDEFIRSTKAGYPCTPKVGPWVLAATILGSSMVFQMYLFPASRL